MTTTGATLELNPAQRAAVEHLHGPLLVIAGAGTGKTRVLTERILYLLHTIPDLEGESILAVTYTNKAVAEMRDRIRRRGSKRAERVEVHTFHAFCYQLLQRHHQALRILDEIDQWIFLRRRLERLGLNLFRKLSEPGRFLKDFTEFFSRCQDELVSPADYQNYVDALARRLEQERALLNTAALAARQEELERQREIARVYAAATDLLREAQRTTFGGSLFDAVTLLRNNQALREHYQDRLRYILVDEFQDANIAQIELLALLAERHRNLMAVGDDDQAIYRFRGASYASFRKFAELYPDHRRISLNQNYRSTGRILSVATTLIAQNGTARFDPNKTLLPRSAGGEKVRLAEVEEPLDEAAYVRSELERLQQRQGNWNHTAVLYRAHNHRNALVEELIRARIPFVISGLSILNHILVRDLLAFLRVLHDPRDNISFARLLAIPAWRLTPEMLIDLIERARRDKVTLSAAVESLHPDVRDRHTALGDLLSLLADLRARAADLPLVELFDLLLERLGLCLLPTDPDRPFLQALASFLRTWQEEKSETRRLPEFIEYLNYFEEAGGTINLSEDTDNRDAVQLMTVHAAKGLEFNSVFVLRLNRNDFPTTRRHPLFEFPAELMKEALPTSGDFHIQEERRLCYVALTRARQRLALATLTGPRRHPSVFLEDILRNPHTARDIEQLEPEVAPADPTPRVFRPEADTSQPSLFADPPTAAAYSRIAAWARLAAPDEASETLTLSHSALETYWKCPLKYKFSYEWRLPAPPTPAMLFGQIMHRTAGEFLRAWQRNSSLPLGELQHLYELKWHEAEWPFADAYQAQAYRESGWEQLQIFYQQTRERMPAVLELEKRFQWEWEDITLTGGIDQINRLDARTVEIVEYKTGEPRPPRTVEKSDQLALYALAVRNQLGLVPARLTLYNFTVNEAVSFTPQENQLKKTLEKVRDAAARIRAGEFAACPGYHCRYCDYQRVCPAFEQAFTLNGEAAEGESGEEGSLEN